MGRDDLVRGRTSSRAPLVRYSQMMAMMWCELESQRPSCYLGVGFGRVALAWSQEITVETSTCDQSDFFFFFFF